MKTQPNKTPYRTYLAVFILAVIFWFTVKMSKNYDYAVDIPLKLTINNDEIWLKYPAPEEVRVEFEGRGIDLLQLSFYEPRYEIDLSAERDRFVLNLSEHREYVHVSEEVGVKVNSIIRPHEIQFDLDQRREKKIPVKVRADVETDNGFILVDVVSNPDSVRLIGPATFVDTLDTIYTVLKNYSEIKRAFEDGFAVVKNERFYGTYIPERVRVFFDVQRLAEKEIREVPVTVKNVPDNYEAVPLPSTVKVYVKGGEKILAEAEVSDFEVFIDYKEDWQPENNRASARVVTSLNVSYVETRPATFEMIVQKKRR